VTVVDSSAVIAVLTLESDATVYANALQEIEPLFMSAGTLLEIGTVALHREGPKLVADAYALIELSKVEVVAFSDVDAQAAIEAYARFGKCTRHPAQLNFGDCFSYALAKALDQPLLYKGNDFSRTDVRSAL
jgi:ribonuclease VapC